MMECDQKIIQVCMCYYISVADNTTIVHLVIKARNCLHSLYIS